MPQTEFLIFEVLMFLLFALCLVHALRRGPQEVLELFFGLVYGVLLEWMTIQQLQAYQYGHFMLMLDGAPICIGLGWAVIIYSGMLFTSHLVISEFARPFLIGLLALNIDLAMDVIAIRLGFWDWAIPANSEWFGVPWGNFWAWFIVVTSYSGLLIGLRASGWHKSASALKRWGYVPLAFVISLGILAFTNWFYTSPLPDAGQFWAMILLVLAGCIPLLADRPTARADYHLDWVAFSVPLVFHLYFNFAGFYYGIYARLPILGVVGVLMLVLGLYVHLHPLWKVHHNRQ